MAQLNKNPIGAAELTQFVNERSDFAFEMEVLARLRGAEFVCSHSGTYRDPVTEKIRQYVSERLNAATTERLKSGHCR